MDVAVGLRFILIRFMAAPSKLKQLGDALKFIIVLAAVSGITVFYERNRQGSEWTSKAKGEMGNASRWVTHAETMLLAKIMKTKQLPGSIHNLGLPKECEGMMYLTRTEGSEAHVWLVYIFAGSFQRPDRIMADMAMITLSLGDEVTVKKTERIQTFKEGFMKNLEAHTWTVEAVQ